MTTRKIIAAVTLSIVLLFSRAAGSAFAAAQWDALIWAVPEHHT